MISASLNSHYSASTALVDDYHKTLLDITNCQKSGFRQKSVLLILVKIKQFIVLIMRTYVLRIAQHVTSDPGQSCDQDIRFCFGFALDCASDLSFWKTAALRLYPAETSFGIG